MKNIKVIDCIPPELLGAAKVISVMEMPCLKQLKLLKIVGADATAKINDVLGSSYVIDIMKQTASLRFDVGKILNEPYMHDIINHTQFIQDSLARIMKKQQFSYSMNLARDISRFAEQLKGMDLAFESTAEMTVNDLEEMNTVIEEVGNDIKKSTSLEEGLTFLKILLEKHPQIQYFLIICRLLYDLSVGFAGSALYDKSKEWMSNPGKYDTPKVIKQDVRKMSIDRSLLKNLRFVNVEVLNVRAGKSVRSMIIDRLKLGQTLEVLSKNKDWVYVRYQNCDDEILEGWVYKKYIQKFE